MNVRYTELQGKVWNMLATTPNVKISHSGVTSLTEYDQW